MRVSDYLWIIQPTEDLELGLTMYNVDISVQKQINLQEATENDEELKMLKQVINGWPETVKDVSKLIRNYWS